MARKRRPRTAPKISRGARIGEKGRIVIPADIRRATNLPVGADVQIFADEEGRIVIESFKSVFARAGKILDEMKRETQ